MNNTINQNNNVPFQAKLNLNSIKGRNGIAEKIATEFERISEKQFPNDVLDISRPGKYERTHKEEVHNLYASVPGNFKLIINDFKKVLSMDPKKVTKKDITASAKKLLVNLKTFKAEMNCENEIDGIDRKLAKINRELRLQEYVKRNIQNPVEPKQPSRRTLRLMAEKEKLEAQREKVKERFSNYVEKNVEKGYSLDLYDQGLIAGM